MHDIAALDDILHNKEFMKLLQKSFEADKCRGGIENNYTLFEFIKITFDKLTEDKIYEKEYSDFVASMCYGAKDAIITFEKSLKNFEKLYNYIKNTI